MKKILIDFGIVAGVVFAYIMMSAFQPGVNEIIGEASSSIHINDACLNFDGTDDYVNIPHNANQLLTTGGTIEAWINPDTVGENNDGFIVCKMAGTWLDGYRLSLYSPDGGVNNYAYFLIDAGTPVLNASNNILPGSGNWYHVVATWNAAGLVTLYVNGAVSGTPAVSADPAGIITTDAIRIGNRSTATDRTFDGKIKMVRIYSRTLALAEIAANYALGHQSCPDPISDTGLIGYWKLDDNAGTTALDSSTTLNYGTVSGATWFDENSELGVFESTKNMVDSYPLYQWFIPGLVGLIAIVVNHVASEG